MFPWVWKGAALASCGSTQDECERLSGGRPGLIVTAMEQTAGRGRLGRVWSHGARSGLAVTIGLDPAKHTAATMSLAGGIAACHAVKTWIVGPAADTTGLKWPNDVVARCSSSGIQVKAGGVLVEVKNGLALLGIGINVTQRGEDIPEELRGRAASIAMLSSTQECVSRLDVLGTLLVELDRVLKLTPEEICERWKTHDVLTGTEQVFEHAGKRTKGIVRRIEPAEEIVVDSGGTLHRLPAASSTLVKTEVGMLPARS
jgi:BirA family biotin operon repressor/biotin-[acetyl-CoA-carboxylase] ligase